MNQRPFAPIPNLNHHLYILKLANRELISLDSFVEPAEHVVGPPALDSRHRTEPALWW